jgi:hypothetical protein
MDPNLSEIGELDFVSKFNYAMWRTTEQFIVARTDQELRAKFKIKKRFL